MFNAAEQKTFSINLLKQPTLTHSQNTHIHTKYTFMYHLCISFMFVCACILFDIQFLYKYLYMYLRVLFNMRCFTNIYLSLTWPDWNPHLDRPNCQVLAVIWPAPAAAARQMPRVRSPFCPLFWSFPKHIRSTFCVTSSPNWMWMCRTLSWRPSIHSTCVPGK